jgi:hypothetical protein
MNKTDQDILRLEKLLADYKITETIPPEIKNYTRLRKSGQFKRIMKACGQYTLLSAAASALYFFFKKTGIGITLTKTLFAAVITASISTGSYYAVQKIYREKSRQPEEKELQKTGIPAETDRGPVRETAESRGKPAPAAQGKKAAGYILGIMPLQSDSVSEKNLQRITNSLYGQITAKRNYNFAKILSHRKITGVKYTAFGSIEKIEDYYYLVVKVMDTGTTRIVFNTSRELNSLNDAEREFQMIYTEVLRIIKKR